MISEGVRSKLYTLGIVCPPVVTVLVLAILSLRSATVNILQSSALTQHLDAAEGLRHLVTALQKERGMTCAYLGRDPKDKIGRAQVAKRLSVFRQETDVFVMKVCDCSWPDTRYGSRPAFRSSLEKYRASVGVEVTECSKNVEFYADVNNHLIGSVDKAFLNSDEGRFWSEVRSINTLLSAKEIIGVKRALGSGFFPSGGFEHQFAQLFQQLTGAAEKLFSMVWVSVPRAANLYKKISEEHSTLLAELAEMEQTISYNNLTEGDAITGLNWFQNMTTYIGLIGKVEKSMAAEIGAQLEVKIDDSWINFAIVLVACGLSALLCPILVVKYGAQVNQGRKAEDLLYQLMPKSVAIALQRDGKVKPVNFASVTIYHCDIVGFDKLSADSTPFEMVELLNLVYSKYDEIMAKYDAYKAESTGGALMVVSGLPETNGDLHSDHICTMALEMMEMLHKFHIPHKPQDTLLVRMGISTGPCAAGIVGIKTPRYCLFGQTAHMAVLLQETARACTIQISIEAETHLRQSHELKFSILSRGPLKLNDGYAQSAWLIGKQGMNFSIDLKEAEERARNSSYWQVNSRVNSRFPSNSTLNGGPA